MLPHTICVSIGQNGFEQMLKVKTIFSKAV